MDKNLNLADIVKDLFKSSEQPQNSSLLPGNNNNISGISTNENVSQTSENNTLQPSTLPRNIIVKIEKDLESIRLQNQIDTSVVKTEKDHANSQYDQETSNLVLPGKSSSLSASKECTTTPNTSDHSQLHSQHVSRTLPPPQKRIAILSRNKCTSLSGNKAVAVEKGPLAGNNNLEKTLPKRLTSNASNMAMNSQVNLQPVFVPLQALPNICIPLVITSPSVNGAVTAEGVIPVGNNCNLQTIHVIPKPVGNNTVVQYPTSISNSNAASNQPMITSVFSLSNIVASSPKIIQIINPKPTNSQQNTLTKSQSVQAANPKTTRVATTASVSPYHNCPVCDKRISEPQLITHLKVHEMQGNEKCSKCHSKIQNYSYSIIQTHVSGKCQNQYTCKDCGQCYNDELFLRAHQNYAGHKPFRCSSCNASFFLDVELRTHRQSFHSEGEAVTDTNSNSNDENMLQNNDKMLFASNASQNHIEPFYLNLPEVHPKKTHIICHFCNMKFRHKVDFQKHFRKHKVEDEVLQEMKKIAIDTCVYKCKVCNKVLKNERCFLHHIRNHRLPGSTFLQPTKGIGRFICTICQRVCGSTSGLTIHRQKMHSDHPDVSRSNSSSGRIAHSCNRTMKNSSNFALQCKICSKNFHSKKGIRWHLQAHKLRHKLSLDFDVDANADTDCKCECCGKICTSKKALKKHLFRYHVEKDSTTQTVSNRSDNTCSDGAENNTLNDNSNKQSENEENDKESTHSNPVDNLNILDNKTKESHILNNVDNGDKNKEDNESQDEDNDVNKTDQSKCTVCKEIFQTTDSPQDHLQSNHNESGSKLLNANSIDCEHKDKDDVVSSAHENDEQEKILNVLLEENPANNSKQNASHVSCQDVTDSINKINEKEKAQNIPQEECQHNSKQNEADNVEFQDVIDFVNEVIEDVEMQNMLQDYQHDNNKRAKGEHVEFHDVIDFVNEVIEDVEMKNMLQDENQPDNNKHNITEHGEFQDENQTDKCKDVLLQNVNRVNNEDNEIQNVLHNENETDNDKHNETGDVEFQEINNKNCVNGINDNEEIQNVQHNENHTYNSKHSETGDIEFQEVNDSVNKINEDEEIQNNDNQTDGDNHSEPENVNNNANENNSNKCKICEATFLSQALLGEHLHRHSVNDNLSLDPMIGMHKEGLLTNGVMHDQSNYTCYTCNSVFNNKKALHNHVEKSHSSDKIQLPAVCQICNKEFTSVLLFQKHQALQHNIKQFHCKTCDVSFKWLISLKRHNMATHGAERPFECSQCNMGFILKCDLIKHKNTTHSETKPSFSCSVCGKAFTTEKSLKKHDVQKHNTAKARFKCSQCNKVFPEKHKLVIHQKRHSNERPFKCPDCTKCFKCRKDVKSHQRTHVTERNLKCNLCDEMFMTKQTLQQHMIYHDAWLDRPFQCTQCQRGFNYEWSLKSHNVLKHGELPFECKFCKKKYLKQKSLKRHELMHVDGIKKDIKCPKCPKMFESLRVVTFHFRRVHLNLKPHKCKICKSRFKDMGSLTKHLTQHKCKFCGKKYKRLNYVVNHMRIEHSGERPFKCIASCGKQFVHQSAFRKHQELCQEKVLHDEGMACEQRVGQVQLEGLQKEQEQLQQEEQQVS